MQMGIWELSGKTVAQLQQICRELNIPFTTKLRKQDLIDLVLDRQSMEQLLDELSSSPQPSEPLSPVEQKRRARRLSRKLARRRERERRRAA